MSRLLCAILLTVSVLAADDAAFSAYRDGDHQAALRLYRERAANGDPLALYNYAMVLKRGEGSGDTTDWRPLLRRAAEAGLAQAAYALGVAYENGDGVGRSQPEATRWFRQAALSGHVEAELSLATQYFLGRGVTRDYREAARWYRAAAEHGHAGAQYLLASMLEHGDGVARDLMEAMHWYSLAARQGDQAAALQAKRLAQSMTVSPPNPAPCQ
ncbi:tetratricopeptide repeat protein [Chitinimonas lacunae]|uniref:Tetratricopeptide repeat protein n=1 Tax=Chitinimonas lacunae TaxID=1963018 RepID=A0ABV8ML81_9NEIS